MRDDPHRKPDKDEEKKVKAVLERLRHYGIDNLGESNVEYALRSQSSQGDPEAAFRLLMLLEDTYEGIVKPYSPDMKLRGAVNREAVTCYLDALLFAMFAKLDSFEAMLYDNFEDIKRKRLAGLLRLWVNMLRTGRLITTDITSHLQHALADCGWTDAARLKQQDPSEAFGFITGQLELPMLTLKMDMFHTGKEDPQDDHKFVNERLLEVAILDEPPEGTSVITLEHCLEHYFNNRIEVKRHMENRRNTMKTDSAYDSTQEGIKIEKEPASHVEVVEVVETPTSQSPAGVNPFSEGPSHNKMTRADTLRPTLGRKRADSIFSQRKVEVIEGVDATSPTGHDTTPTQDGMGRKLSTRTEVLMPAWQFFKLLPWYTNNMPTTDAQVAAHFSKKRPVLGICLKRYSYTNTGQARRLGTYVDIPLEIAVPNFVSDDNMQEEGPLMGNFRLLLQSVVCHRGVSVNSGHYICLCRGRAANAVGNPNPGSRRSSIDSEDLDDPWMRFDDLAKERVTYVNIHDALKEEMPYLLFYQVQPIGDVRHHLDELPSYTEATSRSQSDAMLVEKPVLADGSTNALTPVMSDPFATNQPSTEVTDVGIAPERLSTDTTTLLDPPRGRSTEESDVRRKSITFDASSLSGESARTEPNPTNGSTAMTQGEEKTNNTTLLSVANKMNVGRRGSRVSKTSESSRSRPSSRDGTNRFSLNMTRLTQMVSRSDGVEPTESVAAPAENTSTGEHEIEKLPVAGAAPSAAHVERVAPIPPPTLKAIPKSRKEKAAAKRKGGEKEERDCVLM